VFTKQYYNKHAQEIVDRTLNVDLKPIYTEFEHFLKPGGKILDVGFGSGRDSLHFYKMGYDVVSIDYAENIVARGKILLNNEVLLVDFNKILYDNEFDGIWASAIFLHFTEDEILEGLKKCSKALQKDGIVYISFKYGEEETIRNGRFFNDFTETKFEKIVAKCNLFKVEKIWQTQDARQTHTEKYWLNIILKKK